MATGARSAGRSPRDDHPPRGLWDHTATLSRARCRTLCLACYETGLTDAPVPGAVDRATDAGRGVYEQLSPFDRRLYDLLWAHGFFRRTCWPSQALLAVRLGCSREWVNRRVGHLRDVGLISIDKRRRRGSRWDHNVYTLRGPWHRPYRRPTLVWLREFKPRCVSLLRRVHTKRTATTALRSEQGFEGLSRGRFDGPGRGPPQWIAVGGAGNRKVFAGEQVSLGRDNVAWVAEHVGTSRRREILSWSHHAEVAVMLRMQVVKP